MNTNGHEKQQPSLKFRSAVRSNSARSVWTAVLEHRFVPQLEKRT